MPLKAGRSLSFSYSSTSYVCRSCRHNRQFSSSSSILSGHNKWSSIKHDKAKNDSAKNRQRSVVSHAISNASKFYGADPNSNPRLALAIATAKKAGIPKTLIEAAIARGQGVSASGAALENVTVEAIFPPGVATVIDCQTDNKLRTLADIRLLIKVHQGSVTPTGYLFERRGRVVLNKGENLEDEKILEAALEAGALDVEEAHGKSIVFTEVNDTKAVAKSLSESLGTEIEEAEIIWDPNEETMVAMDNADDVQNLAQFIEKMHDQIPGLQAIYHNASQSEGNSEQWHTLQSRVASY